MSKPRQPVCDIFLSDKKFTSKTTLKLRLNVVQYNLSMYIQVDLLSLDKTNTGAAKKSKNQQQQEMCGNSIVDFREQDEFRLRKYL